MRTIKGGVADKEGMRYSLNVEIVSRNDDDPTFLPGLSISSDHALEDKRHSWEERISNSRIARKGKFY